MTPSFSHRFKFTMNVLVTFVRFCRAEEFRKISVSSSPDLPFMI